MIIIKDANEKRVLLNLAHITHMEDRETFVLIFLECGAVIRSADKWEELIMKIKSIGGAQ
jgi:hypothetical protein